MTYTIVLSGRASGLTDSVRHLLRACRLLTSSQLYVCTVYSKALLMMFPQLPRLVYSGGSGSNILRSIHFIPICLSVRQSPVPSRHMTDPFQAVGLV